MVRKDVLNWSRNDGRKVIGIRLLTPNAKYTRYHDTICCSYKVIIVIGPGRARFGTTQKMRVEFLSAIFRAAGILPWDRNTSQLSEIEMIQFYPIKLRPLNLCDIASCSDNVKLASYPI